MRMMRLAPNFPCCAAPCARKARICLIQRFLDPPHAFSPAFAQLNVQTWPTVKAKPKFHKLTRCKTRAIWALFVKIKGRRVFKKISTHFVGCILMCVLGRFPGQNDNQDRPKANYSFHKGWIHCSPLPQQKRFKVHIVNLGWVHLITIIFIKGKLSNAPNSFLLLLANWIDLIRIYRVNEGINSCRSLPQLSCHRNAQAIYRGILACYL